MSTHAHDELEKHYANTEASFKIEESPEYGPLVTANGNGNAPIHRWFRMKEAYSNRLLERLIYDTGLGQEKSLDLLDPFSGSGTTGVSTGDLVRSGRLETATVRAIEVNPFLHLVSAAKMAAHLCAERDTLKIAGKIARRAMSEKDGLASKPALSTFDNSDYFSTVNLTALRALKASTEHVVDEGVSDELRLFLSVALAATVEPSSNLRRDGRALRLSPGKASASPIDTFLGVAARIDEDVTNQTSGFGAEVVQADSRNLQSLDETRFDLSVFSPPYPNNIDYTEVYKLEGWFLGLYGSSSEFSSQRRQTLRSHSSLRWGSNYTFESKPFAAEIETLIAPILAAVPADRYSLGRQEVIRGYVDDMLSTIEHVHSALRGGGRIVVVVGNSMHGKSGNDYVIASDLLIARLAELVGFAVEQIRVARYPKRRTSRSQYLRESVVVARKAF